MGKIVGLRQKQASRGERESEREKNKGNTDPARLQGAGR